MPPLPHIVVIPSGGGILCLPNAGGGGGGTKVCLLGEDLRRDLVLLQSLRLLLLLESESL